MCTSLTAFIVYVFLCKWPPWRWTIEAKSCSRSITKLKQVVICGYVCAVIWIKRYVVSLLHEIWITLNCMGKFANIDDCGGCLLTCSSILYSCKYGTI